MKAVLIATGKTPENRIPDKEYLPPLLPLIDRPFIQHVVEHLVSRGVKELEVVLCQFPEKFKQLLGDGNRWGTKIRYHLVKDPLIPYGSVRFVEVETRDDPVLLVHADRLPQADFLSAKPSSWSDGPALYVWEDRSNGGSGKRPDWSGWGWLGGKCRAELPDGLDEEGLLNYLLSFSGCNTIILDSAKSINVQSYPGLLSAHRAVLSKRITGLMMTAREIESGVWLSRNVQLHPTAQVKPPVYIGENCNIGMGVRMGPYAVVGDNCVIDAKSTITDAVIFSESYVGEALELRDSLVARNRLINVRLESEVTVTEDFILGSLTERRIREWFRKILSQITAAALLILLIPLFVVIFVSLKLFRKNEPLFHRSDKVRLPMQQDMALWQTFSLISFSRDDSTKEAFGHDNDTSRRRIAMHRVGWRDLILRFVPALINVARGELRFVGVTPRTVSEVKEFSQDLKSIYLKSKSGIVSDALVNFGPELTEDELYVAETFYAVSSGLKYDLKLLGRYFGQILGLVPKP
jgi:lipopolysaccharide/colanic/teichoic acid biosynthesis glycosyltransferase